MNALGVDYSANAGILAVVRGVDMSGGLFVWLASQSDRQQNLGVEHGSSDV